LTYEIRKLFSNFTDFKDVQPQEKEKKEDIQPERFDWLFCNFNVNIAQQLQVKLSSVKNIDTKLLKTEVEI
jgi:hypothetical protein